MDALDAYESIRVAEQLHERLTAACVAVENKRVIKDEKAWLATARDLLAEDCQLGRSVVERARMLPELIEVRQEFATGLQQLWVDALEKLLAGITYHAGSRAPLIETLFPHQKFPVLRKPNRETVTAYQTELLRRTKLSYVQRMLADEAFAFVKPCVDAIEAAYATWMTSFSNESMPEEQAAPLRAEIVELGERLELKVRQAKLLAEAALVPVKNGFEEFGLNVKAKKRGKKVAAVVSESEEAPAFDPVGAEEPSGVESGGVEAATSEVESASEVTEQTATSESVEGTPETMTAESAPTAAASGTEAPVDAAPAPAPAPKKQRKKKAEAPPAPPVETQS